MNVGKLMKKIDESPPLSVNRKRGLPLLVAMFVLNSFCLVGCGGFLRDPTRAIILISLDTLRADMLNTYGYEEYRTSPFLDAFAAENIVFENCIVQEPWTLTSHMSLMTGMYPQHHEVRDETVLPAEIPTLASLLKAEGFATQAFVDGGYLNKHWGFDRGFDGYEDRGIGLERILAKATEWLQERGEEKFFLFLHSYDIHSKGNLPYYRSPAPFHRLFSKDVDSDLNAASREQFKAAWEGKSNKLSDADKQYIRATYAEGIRYVDDRLEKFFEFLRGSGIYDRALIIIWSDHGEGLYHHETWSHSELFDHTIRVPLIMRIPGSNHHGKRVRSIVSSIDIAPTILELANSSDLGPIDGESILHLLGAEDEERLAFSIGAKMKRRRFSVRSLDHHFYWDENNERGFFFDLRGDPREVSNLYPSETPAAESLQAELFAWIEEYQRARETGAVQDPEALDEHVREGLRALGYGE